MRLLAGGAFRVGRVRVQGRSMLPTLHPGDHLLVRWGAPVREGRLVVVRLAPREPGAPGVLSVKRAWRREAAGWWVERDNAVEGVDSWLVGTIPDADVLGVVLARYWPPDRRLVRRLAERLAAPVAPARRRAR
jgi:hypothetical protein